MLYNMCSQQRCITLDRMKILFLMTQRVPYRPVTVFVSTYLKLNKQTKLHLVHSWHRLSSSSSHDEKDEAHRSFEYCPRFMLLPTGPAKSCTQEQSVSERKQWQKTQATEASIVTVSVSSWNVSSRVVSSCSLYLKLPVKNTRSYHKCCCKFPLLFLELVISLVMTIKGMD